VKPLALDGDEGRWCWNARLDHGGERRRDLNSRPTGSKIDFGICCSVHDVHCVNVFNDLQFQGIHYVHRIHPQLSSRFGRRTSPAAGQPDAVQRNAGKPEALLGSREQGDDMFEIAEMDRGGSKAWSLHIRHANMALNPKCPRAMSSSANRCALRAAFGLSLLRAGATAPWFRFSTPNSSQRSRSPSIMRSRQATHSTTG
jgi:hypothetical protein